MGRGKLRERPELWDSHPFLLVNLAEARLDLHGSKGAGEVIAFLEPRIATLEERGWGAYLADALRTRARAATLLGDRQTAERDLHAARERYQAMDAPHRVGAGGRGASRPGLTPAQLSRRPPP